jgi:hypothetical protein
MVGAFDLLTNLEKKLKVMCIDVFEKFQLSSLMNSPLMIEFNEFFNTPPGFLKHNRPFNNDDLIHLRNAEDAPSKNIIRRFFSFLDYLQILLLDVYFTDKNMLLIEVSRCFHLTTTDIKKDSKNYLLDIINENRDIATKLLDYDFISLYLFYIKGIFIKSLQVFNINNTNTFEYTFNNLDKRRLVILDYFFDDFCYIDDMSKYQLTVNLLPIHKRLKSNLDDNAKFNINECVDKIYLELCDLIAIENKAPSLSCINKLSQLLKLSNITIQKYNDIITNAKTCKRNEIFNSVLKKVNDFDNQNPLFKFDSLFLFYIYRILDYDYFQLFKLLIPLSLLSKENVHSFNKYMFYEHGVGVVPSPNSRYSD